MLDKFYVFTNTKDTKLLAVTRDREGANLPQGNGHWRYWKDFNSGLSGRIAFGLKDPAEAYAAIEKQGYYLWHLPRLLRAA